MKKRFRKLKQPKYGNINKGFTDAEYKRFIACVRNEKAYCAFLLMANLGLRVGEVVKLKIDDIDFYNRKVRVSTEKAHTGDLLYMHDKVRNFLKMWVQKLQDEILSNAGYILPSNRKDREHVSPNWLRMEFRKACKLADLNMWYDYAEDDNNAVAKKNGKNRKLYRLTTHSLRHYFISKVYNKCANPLQTQKLARHRSFKSTQTYIHQSQEKIDETMKSVFESEGVDVKESKEAEDFVKFFKMWKVMSDVR